MAALSNTSHPCALLLHPFDAAIPALTQKGLIDRALVRVDYVAHIQ